jgi:hypothetical protein
LGERQRIEHVGPDRLDRGAARREPVRHQRDLIDDHPHEDIAAGRHHESEFAGTPGRGVQFPGGVAAVALYRLANAARRFGPHAGTPMQHTIQCCDADPRLASEILQREVSRRRFHIYYARGYQSFLRRATQKLIDLRRVDVGAPCEPGRWRDI